MYLHFSTNYFPNITFPIRYFQRKITIAVAKVPTHFQQQGGKYKEKYKDAIVTINGELLLSYISSVEIHTDYIWDTDEEIMELIYILFGFFENNDDIIPNKIYTINTEEDDEEAFTYIISLLDDEENGL